MLTVLELQYKKGNRQEVRYVCRKRWWGLNCCKRLYEGWYISPILLVLVFCRTLTGKNLRLAAPLTMQNEYGEIVLYQAEDGKTSLEVKLQDDTLWLTQVPMAELFYKDVRTINEHLKTIFKEGELKEDSTIRKFRIVRQEAFQVCLNSRQP